MKKIITLWKKIELQLPRIIFIFGKTIYKRQEVRRLG